MLNPITPIVLIFQRALYAQLTSNMNGTVTQVLPDWSWSGYALVPRLLLRVRRDVCW